MNNEFEMLIEEHENLDLFLNNKELVFVPELRDFKVPNEAFLDYVSPRYLESFTHEFNSFLTTNLKWKLPKLYKLRRICNAETSAKCDQMVVEYLEANNKKIEDFIQKNTFTKTECLEMMKSFGLKITEAYNNLPLEKNSIKEAYGLLCAKLLKSLEPALDQKGIKKSSDEQINLFGELMNGSAELDVNNELKSALIKFKEDFNSNFDKVVKKETGKANVWLIIGVIVIVIRILLFLARNGR